MSSAWSSLRRCLPSWSYRPGSLCLPGTSASRRAVGGRHGDGAWEGVSPPAGGRHAAQGDGSDAGERFADRVLAMAGVVLTLAGLALLAMHWQLFIAVRWQGMVALVVLLLLAVAIGHVLGGPHPDDRTALAIACATRRIGVAVIVAAFRGPRTMVLLAAYVVASAVVSIVPPMASPPGTCRGTDGGGSVTCWRSKSEVEACVVAALLDIGVHLGAAVYLHM